MQVSLRKVKTMLNPQAAKGYVGLGMTLFILIAIFMVGKKLFGLGGLLGKSEAQQHQEDAAAASANEIVNGSSNYGHATHSEAFFENMANAMYDRFSQVDYTGLINRVQPEEVKAWCVELKNSYDYLAIVSTYGTRNAGVLPTDNKGLEAAMKQYCSELGYIFWQAYTKVIKAKK